MELSAGSRTEQVDRLVIAAAADCLTGEFATPFAVLAVGGYGRRELFPFSDVDVVLLLEREPDPARLKEPLGHFLRILWDSSIQASHSVRTIDECCRLNEGNPHLSISLLDVRFLCGDAALYRTLTERLPDFYRRHSRPLLRSLAELTTGRHAKFGHTVYHLEPHIKEGPGGIRDIQYLHWAGLLAADKEPLRQAAVELHAARDFLYRLRSFLHQQSGRDNNLLSFELQEKAARDLPPDPLPPEDWMRTYFRHARTVYQSCLRALELVSAADSGLLRQFIDRRGRLSTADYTVSHNRVFLRNPALSLSSLSAVFDLFTYAGKQGVPFSWDTHRRLRERAPWLIQAAADEPVTWKSWHTVLSQPHAALALREMHDSGVLAACLPQWRSIDSLVVPDFYHRYTVDEHTLVAIEAIDDLLANRPGTPARFRQLAIEETDLAQLRMALLLHDVGKGTTPGDHIQGSSEAAAAFLERINEPLAIRQTIQFLIAHHLDLSMVMNGRDLDDPATARFLSSQIGTYEDLRKLTLLTYADISAVNPTAMTPWRSEQLWRVHLVASAQLTRDLASERIKQYPAESGVAALLRPELTRFLEGFPTRYLRIHTREQIEEHFRLEQARLRDGLAIKIQLEAGAYILTVLCDDRPGLFAALCGTLAGFGMDIVKAEAASNANGSALDEFRFTDASRTLELNPEEMERLRWTIECVIRGAIDVRDLLKRRPRSARPRASSHLPPTVRFDNCASDRSTLVEFTGEDRPGLLSKLALALTEAGCNIEVVLVNTEAHRAIDVFYVNKHGQKLDGPSQQALGRRLISAANENM